jgi:hypothetical protein
MQIIFGQFFPNTYYDMCIRMRNCNYASCEVLKNKTHHTIIVSDTSGFHGGEDVGRGLLGCDALWFCRC